MKEIKFYIRFENNEEFHKAESFLKEMGAISKHYDCYCKGWTFIENGMVKVISEINPTKNSAIEHAVRHNSKYVIYTVYNFPKEIIEKHKRQNVVRFLTEPIVTQKEYRNTIEVLDEVYNHYEKYGCSWDKDKLSAYATVIIDLKKYIKNNNGNIKC